MKKLTLSADPEVVAQAHQWAAEHGTSVSSMFERFVRLLCQHRQPGRPVGRLARRASGMISLPAGQSEREVLEDALVEKYGLNR